MKINSINYLQNYSKINFQSSNGRVQSHKKAAKDTFTLKEASKNKVTLHVPKHSRDTIYQVLNDCYDLFKENFPDKKISVLFTMRTRKNAKDRIAYSIAVVGNSTADEGITRDANGFTEFLEYHNADFYHAKTIYSNTSEKLNYKKIRTEVLSDFSKAIEEYKNKPALKEEEPRQEESLFKKLLNKIFKK